MDIHGHCDERFARVLDVFERNFTEHGDVGACFAVTVEGDFVVDIWGGHRDAAKTEPWAEDTIVCVYSSTKTMTFLCALLLADRGEIDLYAPVTRYWPEFGQNGKEATQVRHFLSHTSALPGFDPTVKGNEVYDWDFCIRNLERQTPWWEIGTRSGYHAATQGFLIGEVVRRVTGQSIGTFFREEIAEPLGADFHIGVDPRHFHRIGDMVPSEMPPDPSENPFVDVQPGSIVDRIGKSMEMDENAVATAEWRQAEIPAANGHGNARSIVRAQTPLANGGHAFGVDLLSAAGCERILDEQIHDVDHLFGFPLKFGMGYAFGTDDRLAPAETSMFWGGAGGSSVVLDLGHRMCQSYVMNLMSNSIFADTRSVDLGKAVYDCL